jgi:hypothetical protein
MNSETNDVTHVTAFAACVRLGSAEVGKRVAVTQKVQRWPQMLVTSADVLRTMYSMFVVSWKSRPQNFIQIYFFY